jgi:hypothetical protein
MGIEALSATTAELKLGQEWVLSVCVTDVDDVPAAVVPTVAVTLPNGTPAAPTATVVSSGVYRAVYEVAAAGRYVARVFSSGYGAATFAAFVTGTTAATAMPDIEDVGVYLGEHSYSDDQLQDALDAEVVAQRRVCRIPAEYDADLRQALLRRVQRNLAMRGQPGVVVTDDDRPSFVPTNDPEVRRLERPHRRLVMG